MKKIISAILIIFLNSCALIPTKPNENITGHNNSIYITGYEVFEIKSPHFCYFFISTCVSCESIKAKIEVYATEHMNFYMIEAPLSYQKGITKDDSIGAKRMEDIKFLGFPTLIYIENNTLTKMYVGINEITNILF
ncbi:MAG: hypothetical protein J1F31_05210 [Erysipelotrichales bacterium]|nr:hypothetical protein [Erysipelotrichales bacterium]